MSKKNGHLLTAIASELKQRQPTKPIRRKRHCDSGAPIDLRYDDSFYTAPKSSAASFAKSASMTGDDFAAPFGGPASYNVEAFQEEARFYGGSGGQSGAQQGAEDDDSEPTPWGTGELGDEDSGVPVSSQSLASQSFSEDEDAPVWGAGELETLDSNPAETQSLLSRAATDEDEPTVWGAGELETLDAAPASETPATSQSLSNPPPNKTASLPAPPFVPSSPSDDPETVAFQQDINAILAGQKDHPSTRPPETPAEPERTDEPVAQPSNLKPHASGYPHEVFDAMGQSMSMAKTFNLGSFALTRKFDAFDAEIERQDKKKTPLAQPSSLPTASEFSEDVGLIRQQSLSAKAPLSETKDDPRLNNPNWPALPTNVRQMSAAEREAQFGHFDFEADPSQFNGDGIRILGDWRAQNIVPVRIPQLDGKNFLGNPMVNATILFHRLGQQALIDLWADWQSAGLLDRILSYEGGFAPRFIRHTEDRSPRPLSNHAWGTAFDINARWNSYGSRPALLGQTGCVRELVEIANNHGFFWGGHFQGRPDGMHFELGRVIQAT